MWPGDGPARLTQLGAERVSWAHLVYIAGIPNPDPEVFPPAGSEPEEDAHILVSGDGTFVLDNDWWQDVGLHPRDLHYREEAL